MLEKGRKWQKVEQKDKKLNHCKVDEFQMCMALPCFFFFNRKWIWQMDGRIEILRSQPCSEWAGWHDFSNHNTNIQHSEVLHEFIIVIIVIIIIITSWDLEKQTKPNQNKHSYSLEAQATQ